MLRSRLRFGLCVTAAHPIPSVADQVVGLLVGRVERRSAWSLLGFLPAFALSIWITTRAYLDGMLGRPYAWVKTTRSGATSTVDAVAPVEGDRR